MWVSLLAHTPDAENIVAIAARLCYSQSKIEELQSKVKSKDNENLISKIISRGHHSVLEHASFTFGIEGISRAASHQLVRHRIASYSQQSQRYVPLRETFPFIIPPSIKSKPHLYEKFTDALKRTREIYDHLIKEGISAEDARFILPNATETKIIVTMNARELNHFFRLRCCNRAQWEMRHMAEKMLYEVKKVAGILFKEAGPGCVVDRCNEGDMGCGKAREVKKRFLSRDFKPEDH